MAYNIYERISEARQKLTMDFASVQDKYEYPGDLDLHPNSDTHGVLLNMILQKGVQAKAVVDRVSPEWRKLARNMDAFVPLDEYEQAVKDADDRKPVRIVVPQSWAARERFKTTMAGIFLRNPIHPIKPGGGQEDYYGALMMERLIQRQSVWWREPLRWMTIWDDASTYGIGPAETVWRRKYVKRMDEAHVGPVLAALRKSQGTPFPKQQEGQMIRYLTDELQFEGQELRPIDPFNCLFDPNVTPNDLQDAEFLGYSYSWNALDLLSEESQPDSLFFNGIFVRMLTAGGQGRSMLSGEPIANRGERMQLQMIRDSVSPPHSHKLDMVQMYVKLIPYEWGIGDSTRPEIWDFCVAGDRVIVKAQPCGYRHGQFPMINCAPTTNGHDVVPVSYIATTYGMQEFTDFLASALVTSMRKNLNGAFAVDPSAFYWEDLLNPGPGMLIRMKPHVGGTGRIDQYIHQFETPDITSQNIANMQLMNQMMKDTSGASDLMQGNMSNLPERPTAELGAAATQAAFSRFHMMAMIIGQQCFYEVGRMAAFNTQQFMSQNSAVEVAGRFEQTLKSIWGGADMIPVSIEDINIDFDMIPLDGSTPGTENVGAWTNIVQTMLANPETSQQIFAGFDATRVFANWARMTGAGNVLDFIRPGGAGQSLQFQVQGDQQVQDQASAGNLLPMSQLSGPPRAALPPPSGSITPVSRGAA